jgi:hypothetical protein
MINIETVLKSLVISVVTLFRFAMQICSAFCNVGGDGRIPPENEKSGQWPLFSHCW